MGVVAVSSTHPVHRNDKMRSQNQLSTFLLGELAKLISIGTRKGPFKVFKALQNVSHAGKLRVILPNVDAARVAALLPEVAKPVRVRDRVG